MHFWLVDDRQGRLNQHLLFEFRVQGMDFSKAGSTYD